MTRSVSARPFPALRSLARPFLDFLSPPLCFHCSSRREPGKRGLCAACWRALRRLDRADPIVRDHVDRLCAQALVDRLVVPYVFEEGGPLRSLLHQLKEGEKGFIGLALGEAIGELLLCEPPDDLPCGLVPVPLHRSRHRERGYNQSALIASGISRVTRVPLLPDLLVRIRPTPVQTALGSDARKKNVEGAFSLGRGPLMGRSGPLLLVDDVISSGSTMSACAATLRRAGVTRLSACASALVR